MAQNYTTLVAQELAYHTHTILREANEGDPDALRWLLDSFPGHEDIFTRLWSGQRVIGLVKPSDKKRKKVEQ